MVNEFLAPNAMWKTVLFIIPISRSIERKRKIGFLKKKKRTLTKLLEKNAHTKRD